MSQKLQMCILDMVHKFTQAIKWLTKSRAEHHLSQRLTWIINRGKKVKSFVFTQYFFYILIIVQDRILSLSSLIMLSQSSINSVRQWI